MAVDIKFRGTYTPPAGDHADIKFGEVPTGGDSNVLGVGTLGGPTGNTVVRAPIRASGVGTLGGPTGTGIVRYDNAVDRGPSLKTNGAWETANPMSVLRAEVFQQGAQLPVSSNDRYTQADPLSQGSTVSQQQGLPLFVLAVAPHEQGDPLSGGTDATYQYGTPMHRDASAGYQQGLGRQRSTMAPHQYGFLRSSLVRALWDQALTANITHDARYHSLGTGLTPAFSALWNQAMQPARGKSIIVVPPPAPSPAPIPCYVPPRGNNVNIIFDSPWDGSKNIVFLCPVGYQPPTAPVVIPVRRVYIVLNEVDLRRVDGNIRLTTVQASLNLSRDSWTWSFSATLTDDAWALLEPDSDGDPVELELMLNGVAYRFLAEKRRRTRTFGKSTVTVDCRGRAAFLDQPYTPVQQFGNDDVRTAQQLMDDVLTLNGSPLGWTVEWNIDDWLVPANVFSHQGSYITALNAIAAAAGAYVQPHATDLTLRVLPGYPTAPWNWAGEVTPDFTLPAAVTTTESIEDINRALYNKVFVRGTKNGIMGEVTRDGTAGDVLAPMVTDPLITEAAAARQRAITILGNTGRQQQIGLKLPVLADTGVILPGKFVSYVDGDTTRLGLVRAVQVEIAMPQVWQQITLETHL